MVALGRRVGTMKSSLVLILWISLGALTYLGGCNSTETPAGTGGAPAAGGSGASGGNAAGGSTSAGGAGGATATGGVAPTNGCGATTLPAACNTTTTGPCTLDVNGTTRQFFVVLPNNYDSSKQYPLVFAWHGLNGTAQSLLGSTYYAGFYGVKTTFSNAIYVTAQGLPAGMSDSGTDYGWPNTNGRDVNFTKAMLTWLEQNYCIDTARIFSTGMSYGGMMSNTLGCQMPDVFRALGVMSGSLYGTSSCSTKPIAVWFTHGDADTSVPIAGDQTARDMFISHNGCSTTNTTTTTLTSTVDGGTVTTVCTIYNQCTAGNYPVVWCPVPGEGHTIPSWAGAEIAKFFQQF
jgi:polyhydroxybutyrate depolymerase